MSFIASKVNVNIFLCNFLFFAENVYLFVCSTEYKKEEWRGYVLGGFITANTIDL